MPTHTDLITQDQLDGMEAHITRMTHDRAQFWLDKKLYGRISGEIIRCRGELHELTRLYKLQSFVVRASGVVITPLCSYSEAVGVAAQVGGVIEPRANS